MGGNAANFFKGANSVQVQTPLNKIIHAYDFDDNLDDIVSGNTGYKNNAQYTTTRYFGTKGLNQNTGNSNVAFGIPHQPINQLSSFSIAMIVQMNFTGNARWLISKGNSLGWLLQSISMRARTYDNQGVDEYRVLTNSSDVLQNKFFLNIVTYNGGNDLYSFRQYHSSNLDGEVPTFKAPMQVDESIGNFQEFQLNTSDWLIGGLGNPRQHIDELLFFNEALTPIEAEGVFNDMITNNISITDVLRNL